MLPFRPLRSLALLGAFAAGGCAYQLNSLAAKSGVETGQTSSTGRPKPAEVDLAYVRAVAANAFARGGKDNSTPWQNPNTGARTTARFGHARTILCSSAEQRRCLFGSRQRKNPGSAIVSGLG
jgi:hypothetical protein